MPFGADLDAWQGGAGRDGPLALIERKKSRFLSWGEVKLLLLASTGYLTDSYDLFSINAMYAMILVAYYPSKTKANSFAGNIDWGLNGGVLKASANIGNIIGQIGFGFLGDTFGRSAVYGKEMIIVIVAVILMISAPDYLGGDGVTKWIFGWRLLMGIGIGGDYPMSAAVVSDRSNLRNRGTLLALIFSAQGWGNFFGAVAFIAIVAAYKGPIEAADYHKLSGAWRIMQGISLVPAFAVLYFRLTLVEATRFTQARRIQDDPEILVRQGIVTKPVENISGSASDNSGELKKSGVDSESVLENEAVGLSFRGIGKRAHNDFFVYFSEWRHLKVLIGTALSWFLIDITFYGINLNSTSILSAIGFTTSVATPTGVYDKLLKTALGNLIITVAGFLPGYYFTVALIEKLGRKPIQMGGFLLNALFFGILAGMFHTLKRQTAPFFVVFVFLQLFFNFGANATTFIVPAEVFPTRVKAGAHGLSAACGKMGAIIASLGFAEIQTSLNARHPENTDFGTQTIFWIFFGISLLGAIVTFVFVPETKGYDADLKDREELAAKAGAAAL